MLHILFPYIYWIIRYSIPGFQMRNQTSDINCYPDRVDPINKNNVKVCE